MQVATISACVGWRQYETREAAEDAWDQEPKSGSTAGLSKCTHAMKHTHIALQRSQEPKSGNIAAQTVHTLQSTFTLHCSECAHQTAALPAEARSG